MNNIIDFHHITAADVKEYDSIFIELVRDRLGLVIHKHQVRDLHKTIASACQKFNCHPREYFAMLSKCPDDSPLLEYLIAGVTIGETYFFRDKKQMQLLQQEVLPQLIKSKREKGNLSLRIWSAGCSTGEEIYTIAMMLREMLPDMANWSIHLLATDISTGALRKALQGQYSEWSMRSIDDRFKQRYFIRDKSKYTLVPAIMDMVDFMYLNLNDDNFPSIINGTNAQDLILCRNVLIYFDSQCIEQLMQKFNLSLVEGGYLILGASDPVSIKGTDLIFHHREGLLFSRPIATPVVVPAPEKISRRPIVLEKPKLISKEIVKPVKEISPEKSLQALMNESRWQAVLDLLQTIKSKHKESGFLLMAEATALANLGYLDKALKACEKGISIDVTNKELHFTLAMILVEQNRFHDAESALRKTLFLDQNFVMGHFQLGLLLLRNKQQKSGLKSLQNALDIAKSHNPTQSVVESPGLQYGHLAEILAKEIKLYTSSGEKSYADRNAR